MSVILKLPRLGETMEEGRVVEWLVAPGVAYKRGDAILEVETDKTVVEVPALEDGVIEEILAQEGDQVQVGAAIAKLAGEKEEGVAPSDAPEPAHIDPPETPAETTTSVARSAGIRATPIARRVARQNGLDIASIPGTGRRGRVERADVERALQADQTAAGLPIAYDVAGPEDGTPVLLLHGFGGDRTLWAGVSASMARAGRRVLALDLPGHGETTIEAATPNALSQGLANLLQQTSDSPVHIVAHSLGAVPAVALAEAGLAKSLTLIAPAGMGLEIDTTFIRGLSEARTAGEVAHLLQRTMELPLPLSNDALEEIARVLGQGRMRGLAEAIIGAEGQAISLRAPLARLAEDLPVRIVAPHRDRILNWMDMTTVSPRIAVHHLPRAGHMAMWDAAAEMQDILRAATEG